MNIYKRHAKLRDSGKLDPDTGKRYACVGMVAVCRKYEVDNGLPPLSIKDRTLRGYVKSGYNSVADVPGRGQNSILPPWVEKNIIKLILACDEKGDENVCHLRARRAVGVYIKGTVYETEFRSKFPGSWSERDQIVVPGACVMPILVLTLFTHPQI